MKIQLSWTENLTGNQQNFILETPIALGSNSAKIPDQINEIKVNKAIIKDNSILGFHGLIEENNNQIIISQQSEALIYINNIALSSSTLFDGDIIKLGSVEIKVNQGKKVEKNEGCLNQIGFLIKRRCGRPVVAGSQYCQQCQTQSNPYKSDYNYYPNYGYYDRFDSWGYDYYSHRHSYHSHHHHSDFTEADGNAFDDERDHDFEQNMGAS